MGECCCVVRAEDMFLTMVRDAIEAGNKTFFATKSPTEQAKIAALQINSYTVLDYCALRNQADIFLYLLSNEKDWITYTKPLLKRPIGQLFSLIFKAASLQMIERTIEILIELGLDIASIRCSKNTRPRLFKLKNDLQSILYFLAKYYGPNCSLKFYHEFFSLPQMQIVKPVRGKPLLPMWLDANGNTPLHQAAKAGNFTALRYFIDTLFISPLIKNKKGKTAFCLILNKEVESKDVQKYVKDWKKRNHGMLSFLLCAKKSSGPISKVPLAIQKHICEFIPKN